MSALAKQAGDPATAETAKPAYEAARDVQKLAKNLIDKINSIKKDLEDKTEGRKKDPEAVLVKGGKPELSQGDNIEVHANYFTREPYNGKEGGRGEELQNLINKTRTDMLNVLKKGGLAKNADTKKFLDGRYADIAKNTSLYAENGKSTDGKDQTWISMYLEHSPLAGVMAMLSKVENDTRNLEAEILQSLAESVSATDFKFDKLAAIVRSPMSSVMTGQTYEADILLAAYSSTADAKILVNGSPIEVAEGIGKYKVTPGGVGEQSFKVDIQVPKGGGGYEMVSTEGKFAAFAPYASISADELNVFYVGLDNPITVSVPGVNPNDIVVTLTGGGNLQRLGAGKYKCLFAQKTADVMVNVSAKMPGGRVANMGGKKFKVKNVPRPVFKVGNLSFNQPTVQLTSLKIQGFARADLENFIYDGVKYNIVKFKFTAITRQGPREQWVTGSSLAPISGMLGSLRSGEYVMFTAIQAQGPGGQTVYLDNVGVTVQ